jgi:hypothetical protein
VLEVLAGGQGTVHVHVEAGVLLPHQTDAGVHRELGAVVLHELMGGVSGAAGAGGGGGAGGVCANAGAERVRRTALVNARSAADDELSIRLFSHAVRQPDLGLRTYGLREPRS